MSILFYRINEEYGCFSNFAPYGFDIDGKYYATSEHYFQSQKFVGTVHEEKVRLTPNPMEAAKMGRNRSNPLRHDWEEVKDDVMRQAILVKFKTHKALRDVLLSTGEEEIIENTSNDYYWGCGKKGNGKNMLGKILMEVRETLRK